MSRVKKYKFPKEEHRMYCPKRSIDEVEPKCGLAYTPADMARMHAAGMPVNSANLINTFYDGDKNPSFDVPLERQRGLDPAEIWEASQVSRGRITKVQKSLNKSKRK